MDTELFQKCGMNHGEREEVPKVFMNEKSVDDHSRYVEQRNSMNLKEELSARR